MEMRPQKVPIIVNTSLESHPLVSGLLRTSKFRPIMTSNTPLSSLIFPSLKASCLVVDLLAFNQSDQFSHIMESCLSFIQSNTKSFILLTPASPVAVETQSEPQSAVNNLIFELSKVSKKTPVVAVALTEVTAVRTVIFMLDKAEKRLEEPEQELSGEEVGARVVAALSKSGILDDKEKDEAWSLLEETSFLGNLPNTCSNLPHRIKSCLEENRSY